MERSFSRSVRHAGDDKYVYACCGGTESNNGIVGVAKSLNKNSTLQNFLKIWGIDLEHKNVVIYVNGKPVSDFKDYILRNGERLNMTIDLQS